jgi:hypothetical protein
MRELKTLLGSVLSGHLAGEFELAEIVITAGENDRIDLDFWARDDTEPDPDLADGATVKLTLADAKGLQAQLNSKIHALESQRIGRKR